MQKIDTRFAGWLIQRQDRVFFPWTNAGIGRNRDRQHFRPAGRLVVRLHHTRRHMHRRLHSYGSSKAIERIPRFILEHTVRRWSSDKHHDNIENKCQYTLNSSFINDHHQMKPCSFTECGCLHHFGLINSP